MLRTLTHYLETLENPEGLCRRLSGMELCRDCALRPVYHTGNSAVVFKIRLRDRLLRLKCYTRPVGADLAAIYGDDLLREELYLFDDDGSGCWVDAVVGKWIEGRTLDEAVREAAKNRDTERLAALSEHFDRLAGRMLSDDRAHGDLKPENIVVTPQGEMQPIDLDASFLPSMQGRCCPELGTEAYRHPARARRDFDARIDDYPAALISTTLAVLRLDPAMPERYAPCDGLLFTPRAILNNESSLYREALDRLAAAGDARHYRIARALQSPDPRMPHLIELFRTPDGPDPGASVPELFEQNGLWGYRLNGRPLLAPLYDCGFDFSEGLAAVRLGGYWHYIDTRGRLRIDASRFDAVKPFRGGTAEVRTRDGRRRIDTTGRIVDDD